MSATEKPINHASFLLLTEGSGTEIGILQPDGPGDRVITVEIRGAEGDPDKAKVDYRIAMSPADAVQIAYSMIGAAQKATQMDVAERAERKPRIVRPH